MKRLLALALGAAGLAPAPLAHAEAYSSQPGNIDAAMVATCEAALIRRGYASALATATCRTDQAATNVWNSLVNGSTNTWYTVMDKLGIPWPEPISEGGYYAGGGSGFDGGGASGTWTPDPDCQEMKYSRDANNELVVPSIPLVGSGPLSRGMNVWAVYSPQAGRAYIADKDKSAMMIYWHSFNIPRGGDKRAWAGMWRIQASGADFLTYASVPAYFDASGVKQGSAFSSGSIGQNGQYTTSDSQDKDCPEGAVGGTFHFYGYNSSANGSYPFCNMYAPNQTLGASGYAYSEDAVIPGTSAGSPSGRTNVDYYIQSNPKIAGCRVATELLRKLADAYFKKITEQPGYAGPPYAPVTAADVKTNGADPTVKDLARDPPTAAPSTVTPTTPTPTPSPTASPTPTPSSSTAPENITIADPTAEDIDWWPDLPSITIDLGNPECPKYPLDLSAFGGSSWVYEISAHCPLVEQNRATIGTIMMLLFGVGAVLVVLRA